MAQVGLKKFYYAKLTKDNSTGVTYETPKRVIGLNSIDINPTVNRATLYGDDAALATASSLGEIEVTVDLADLPLADAAELLGSTITDGEMLSKGADTAPYVAIMFESEKHNGDTRYVKLLKGKFAVSQETTNTRGDSVEFQLPQLSGVFVVREYDGAWKRTKDVAASDTTSTVATTWYASVEPTT